jgi:7,8-didemethyl-8-hydroxy-5-deazariboflavin synthase CofH subunit
MIQLAHTDEVADPRTGLEDLFRTIDPAVARILEKPLEGEEISAAEGERLFEAAGRELEALVGTADRLRELAVGDAVSFVITRNINFTNICYMGCRFCNFSKRMNDPGAEFLPLEEIARRAREAWDRGATEVCIQGGLHPRMKGDHYRNIVLAIKQEVPGIHIHAFSPFEIWFGSKLLKLSPEEFLEDLVECGLGTIPGTAAEILDTEVRQILTQDKLSAAEWVRIVRAAHAAGLRSTATIMYGHVDGPRHWAAHLDLIRSIQKETAGFTEFVPLGFVHYDSPLYLRFGARPGPTEAEHIRMHAVARLMLNGWIDNLQVSWVKMGPVMAQRMLRHGVNDLGGTLMNESISRASGSPYGQEITPREMVDIIRSAGRRPVRRNTLYEPVEDYADHNPGDEAPLVPRSALNAERISRITRTPTPRRIPRHA